jgi:hypothetical protein
MANFKILFPYNFSRLDRKALDLVIETFLPHEKVELVLFHVHPPLPEVDVSAAPGMDRLKAGMHFLSDDLQKKEEELHTVKSYLVENGFDQDQISIIFRPRFKSVAEEIVEAAVSGFFNFVVLSRSLGKATRLFAKSVHNKVVPNLKGISALVVT